MIFQQHRPAGFSSLGDARLPRLINELAQVLIDTQNALAYDTLHLPSQDWARLAHILVEFGEDLHHNLGIWSSLEGHNCDSFWTLLPLILLAKQPVPQPLSPVMAVICRPRNGRHGLTS